MKRIQAACFRINMKCVKGLPYAQALDDVSRETGIDKALINDWYLHHYN